MEWKWFKWKPTIIYKIFLTFHPICLVCRSICSTNTMPMSYLKSVLRLFMCASFEILVSRDGARPLHRWKRYSATSHHQKILPSFKTSGVLGPSLPLFSLLVAILAPLYPAIVVDRVPVVSRLRASDLWDSAALGPRILVSDHLSYRNLGIFFLWFLLDTRSVVVATCCLAWAGIS